MKPKRLNFHKLILSLACLLMAVLLALPFVLNSGKTAITTFADDDDEEEADIELDSEDEVTLYNMILDIESEINVLDSLEEQIADVYYYYSEYPDIDEESMYIYYKELTDLKSTYENDREALNTYFEQQNVSVCSLKRVRYFSKLIIKIALACVGAKLNILGLNLTTECLTHAVYNEVYDSVYSPMFSFKIYDSIEYDYIVSDDFPKEQVSFNNLDNALEIDLFLSIHDFSYTKYFDDDGNCKAEIEDIYDFKYQSLEEGDYEDKVIAIINNIGYILYKYNVITQYKNIIILNV